MAKSILLNYSSVIQKHRTLVLNLLIPCIFAVIMLGLYPSLYDFEFDSDEGINLIKAALLIEGYPLYEATWSDQPPILTYSLAALFGIVGPNVTAARLIILLFSFLLLVSVWRILWVIEGYATALVGVFLVALLPHYAILSVSVMVGLPSLALATAALAALLNWHHNRSWSWLVLSAGLLSLSVLTKLFTGFLAPIFVVGLVTAQIGDFNRKRWFQLWIPAGIWSIAFGGLTLLLLITLVGQQIEQIFEPHLTAQDVMFYEGFLQKNTLVTIQGTLLLAGAGTLHLILHKQWRGLYLVAWLLIGILLLLRHAPIWYHQELLITLPAAMLAGVAVGFMVRWFFFTSHRPATLRYQWVLSLVVVFGLGLVVFDQTPQTVALFKRRAYSNDSESNYRLAATISHYAPQTRWIVTDRPMFAVRAKLLIPPHLAVFSTKRVVIGALTEDDVVDVIRQTRPEQLMIARSSWSTIDFIQEHYYTHITGNLFLRGDLSP